MSDPLLERVIAADYRSGTAKGACRGYCPSDPLSPGPGCRLRSPRKPIRGSIPRHVGQGRNETLVMSFRNSSACLSLSTTTLVLSLSTFQLPGYPHRSGYGSSLRPRTQGGSSVRYVSGVGSRSA